MKKLSLGLIGLFLFGTTLAQNESVYKITGEQNELITEKSKNFPVNSEIAVAIINDRALNFIGLRKEKESDQACQNQKAIFEIGSLTKVFTSTLLANSISKGDLKKKAKINKYLPFKFKDKTSISFEQLANHTSGLPRLPSNINRSMEANPNNPYQAYSEEDLVAYLTEEMTLTSKPGEKYAYSNLGAGLLGYTLSQLENKSLDSLLKEQIFEKYGMNNSTTLKSEIENKLIKGRDKDGEVVSNWDFGSLPGAGAIFSSVEDLSKFVQAQFEDNNSELKLTRQKTFKVSDNMDIGLGWHLIHTRSGKTIYWHNGGTGGYTTSCAFDPDKKIGVIILSNVSALSNVSKNIDELCFQLMKTLQ